MEKKYYIANTDKIPLEDEYESMRLKAGVNENDILFFSGIRFEECGYVKKREATEIEEALLKVIEEMIKNK